MKARNNLARRGVVGCKHNAGKLSATGIRPTLWETGGKERGEENNEEADHGPHYLLLCELDDLGVHLERILIGAHRAIIVTLLEEHLPALEGRAGVAAHRAPALARRLVRGGALCAVSICAKIQETS